MFKNTYDAYQLSAGYKQGRLTLVAYEGGPSIYTDSMDNGSGNTSGITTFMEDLNVRPRIQQAYDIALNIASSAGLVTHAMFTDVGPWSKYGMNGSTFVFVPKNTLFSTLCWKCREVYFFFCS
mgnify:CR=1 FL=1